ncbi:MlaD family protein [Mycolicibacterium fortuitum]|uniref:MlaD family protein n=1 Tax=Mycolicibacterium fortuitum TaxID=1766 RepID=UPI0007EDB3A0|nr:MlaD family protein [Mycolicibacterium fortuitum]NOQ57826.1 MCE family protein [Mycolicibacterium fortuitum]OBI76620.1 mammalian cell entry protein [Mycolicibacterium fortuitum]
MTVAQARLRRLLGLLSATLLTAGCATNGLADLPLPAPGLGSGGYRLTVVFANALNLPEHAKVKLGGADIGQVEDMVARDFTAVTTLRISDDVRLPAGSTAELRSATPLGDVFVSIVPPRNGEAGTPSLRDGDSIGLDSTTAAATVESVLSSAAILVNGGAVHNLTNIVNGMGEAAGPDGRAFGDLVAKSNRLLGTVNARSAQIDSAMTETTRLAELLASKNQEVGELLQAAAPATETLADNTGRVTDLVLTLGDISQNLAKFPSIAGTDASGRSVIADADTIARAFNDVVVDPQTSLASLNRLYAPFIKMTAGTSMAGAAGIDRLVLGSIPDAGFSGDPGLHGPKRADWHQLVGSIKFVLWRLQERVVGRGPQP